MAEEKKESQPESPEPEKKEEAAAPAAAESGTPPAAAPMMQLARLLQNPLLGRMVVLGGGGLFLVMSLLHWYSARNLWLCGWHWLGVIPIVAVVSCLELVGISFLELPDKTRRLLSFALAGFAVLSVAGTFAAMIEAIVDKDFSPGWALFVGLFFCLIIVCGAALNLMLAMSRK